MYSHLPILDIIQKISQLRVISTATIVNPWSTKLYLKIDYYGAILAIFVFLCLRTIYRLILHPLRGIPGPKLAAATSLYEFDYDVVNGGIYIWEVERMHGHYGKTDAQRELAFIILTRGKGAHSASQPWGITYQGSLFLRRDLCK